MFFLLVVKMNERAWLGGFIKFTVSLKLQNKNILLDQNQFINCNIYNTLTLIICSLFKFNILKNLKKCYTLTLPLNLLKVI